MRLFKKRLVVIVKYQINHSKTQELLTALFLSIGCARLASIFFIGDKDLLLATCLNTEVFFCPFIWRTLKWLTNFALYVGMVQLLPGIFWEGRTLILFLSNCQENPLVFYLRYSFHFNGLLQASTCMLGQLLLSRKICQKASPQPNAYYSRGEGGEIISLQI